MSYEDEIIEFYTETCDLCMPLVEWARVTDLALRYGWRPRGTTPPDELAIEFEIWKGDLSQWDGRYFPPCGQQITEIDARYLAEALERALADIPDHDVLAGRRDSVESEPWRNDILISSATVFEVFSGPAKQRLRGFIDHCREGGGLSLY